MSEINYVCCRWRDATTDPPPHGWIGLNVMASGACYYGACGYMPGDQWFDVTDIPAVPRADVQAAVDRLFEAAYLADCECPTCDAIRELADALGIVPAVSP